MTGGKQNILTLVPTVNAELQGQIEGQLEWDVSTTRVGS